MAKSSIFASFDIRDKETAEAFVEALDKSANEREYEIFSVNSDLL